MLRKSQNYMLQKDDVGKSKPSTRALPEPEYMYGQTGLKPEEGVGKRNSYHPFFINSICTSYINMEGS